MPEDREDAEQGSGGRLGSLGSSKLTRPPFSLPVTLQSFHHRLLCDAPAHATPRPAPRSDPAEGGESGAQGNSCRP